MRRAQTATAVLAAGCLLGLTVWAPVPGGSTAAGPAGTNQAGRLAATRPKSAVRAGVGRGVLYIDRDGDGYGVASPLGPDADDTDPTVNTPETLTRKYGSLGSFLSRSGRPPGRIRYISPPPAGGSGPTWATVRPLLAPGDVVVFRKGTYAGKYVISCAKLRGKAGRPIRIMAYPGEKVVLDGEVASLAVKYSSYLIFDGFVLDHTAGSSQAGIPSHDNRHVVYRNLEVRRHYRGWFGMQDLHHILTENCVFHDNLGSHGIYLGARDRPCSEITIRNCLLYRSGRHGIQFNGRVEGLRIENCTIHSNSYGGVSLLNGVCNSVVRGNTIFNNSKQGIVFHLSDSGGKSGVAAYDQTGNVIENNIVWVGKVAWKGDAGTPAGHAAIHLNDSTAGKAMEMGGTVIRGNVLVTYRGPVLRFSHGKFAAAATIEDNLMHRQAGPSRTMAIAEQAYDFSAFGRFSGRIRRNVFGDPGFAGASVEHFAKPELFDFSRKSRERPTATPPRQ